MAELAVVTVSHDARMDFLARQATVLAGETAVREWIVVANGNAALVRATRLGRTPRIVELAQNHGSAVGFAAGLAAALDNPDVARVLLLDGDNLPAPRVIAGLLGIAGDAVTAYRPRLYWAEARGIVTRRTDSCLGFHLFDLPSKLWRRIVGPPPVSSRVTMPSAGYGGLMVSRALVERVGLPEPAFVLYADDTEWTMRARGVTLATGLAMEEMDRGSAIPGGIGLLRWLGVAEAFRLYYGVRNETFVDTHRLRRSRLMHAVNRAAVLALLQLLSRGRKRQFALLREAMAAGEAGRLGVDPRFPLPEIA